MTERTSFDMIAEYLPIKLKEAFCSVKYGDRTRISELRMNSRRTAAVIFPEKIMYLTPWGLTADPRNTSAIVVTPDRIAETVDKLSHFSLHSCSRQLRDGVFVLRHGVRVGLSGCYNSEGIMTDITGLNFRISRNIVGCASDVYELLRSDCNGILICGGVNSGKTTLLRDLCRLTGNSCKVTLVDERNEIAGTNGGSMENDVGELTNVLTGCSRKKGIIAAVRTLSPDYIFCDEISTNDDISAILESTGCGVKFCATVHGKGYDDLISRKNFHELLESNVFSHLVILKGSEAPGKIAEIRRL